MKIHCVGYGVHKIPFRIQGIEFDVGVPKSLYIKLTKLIKLINDNVQLLYYTSLLCDKGWEFW